MKSRQIKINFPKLIKKDENLDPKIPTKLRLDRDFSYECRFQETFVDENEIPKVIIRRKSRTMNKIDNVVKNVENIDKNIEKIDKKSKKIININKNVEKVDNKSIKMNNIEINVEKIDNKSKKMNNIKKNVKKIDNKSKKINNIKKNVEKIDKKVEKINEKSKKTNNFDKYFEKIDKNKNEISFKQLLESVSKNETKINENICDEKINDQSIFINIDEISTSSNESKKITVKKVNYETKNTKILKSFKKINNKIVAKNTSSPAKNKKSNKVLSKKKLSGIKKSYQTKNKSMKEQFLDQISESDEFNDTESCNITMKTTVLTENGIDKHLSLLSQRNNSINHTSIYKDFLKVDQSIKCWNDLYAPKTSYEFLTERHGEVSKFKKWLNDWKVKNDKGTRNKKRKYSHDSDFDDDSGDHLNVKKVKSLCIIIGPTGVGKTALVYAVAKELNYKVLEMNVSSRRTGKDVMSKLSSVTGNKQINFSTTSVIKRRKSNSLTLNPTLKRKHSDVYMDNDALILFDDADIVMNEDAGFWKGIYDIVSKNSRPIILTCSDKIIANKFLTKYSNVSNFKINLVLKQPTVIANYLQTVLLSRNQIFQQDEILTWMSSLNIRNLRSAVNNLHFDSILFDINYRVSLQFNDWSEFKSKYPTTDYEISNKCEEIKISKDNLSNYNVKSSIVVLSSLTDTLSLLDTYKLNNEKFKTNSECSQSIHTEFDSFHQSLFHNIKETSTLLHNSCQNRLLKNCDSELFSPLSMCTAPKLVVRNNNISYKNSVLNSTSEKLDRISAFRIMCSSETERQNSKSSRRFTHYFDRLNLKINKSDLSYLSTPFHQ